MTQPQLFQVRISGAAMSTVEGSELYQRPHLYVDETEPDYDAAIRLGAALNAAHGRRAGKGWTYLVELDRDGAEILEDYYRTQAETYLGETEPEIRTEGRACLKVADRIREQLAEAQR